MADTIVPVPDGVGIFESEPTREKRNKGGRGAVQATTGNDSIGLMIIQVLSGERAKLRVEWQEWQGEWRDANAAIWFCGERPVPNKTVPPLR